MTARNGGSFPQVAVANSRWKPAALILPAFLVWNAWVQLSGFGYPLQLGSAGSAR